MIFKPHPLSAPLPASELEEDKKHCKKFGPCGVGEKAIYLNSFFLERRYYIPFTSVQRVYKRLAMSKGGFTGKGLFATIPYLVVEYDNGKEQQCNFKFEENVDQLLSCLEQGFLERGYDVIACPSPERPSRLEHLLIPALSLAFVTGSAGREGFRTIRTESLVEKAAWQEGRSFLRLSNRVARELLEEAVSHLAQAKARHDELEALYHPYVDFSLSEELARQTAEEILSLPDTLS